MAEDHPKYNPKFEQAKGFAVGDRNIIYNYFGYREEVISAAPIDYAGEKNLPCPYRGLYHFSPNDAEYFFGRDVFIETLFETTKIRNFIPVLGASGSGKSSVVLAGLIPRLEQKQEGNWKFTHFRPGSDPFHTLALALVPLYRPELDATDEIIQARKLAKFLSTNQNSEDKSPLSDVFAKIKRNNPNRKILLIADQFEELYTQCSDSQVRRRFLDCLLTSFQSSSANSGDSSSTVLVTTMRADFLANALAYRPFADMLQDTDIKLGAMTSGLFGALLLAGVAGWQWRQAQIGQIEALSASSKALSSNDQIASLLDALKATKKLKQTFGANADLEAKVRFSLIQAVYSIKEQNRLEKHKGIVNKVRFSPDGEMLASVSGDGTLRLWSLDGQELKIIWEHKSRLLDVSFSPDGKTIVSAGEDGSVKLWTLEGEEIKVLAEQQEPITSFDFSPDGKMLVYGSEDGLIKLRNLSGQEIFTIKGHDDKVNSISFSPDGETIVSGGDDSSIKLWNLNGQELLTIKENYNEVNSVSFSPDGKTIASAHADGNVKLWNFDGTLFGTFAGSMKRNTFFDSESNSSFFSSDTPAISSLRFSPDGKTIVIGNSEGIVRLWTNWKEEAFFPPEEITELGTHKDRVNSLNFSPDGKIVASASTDASIKLWNLSGVEPHILEPNGGSSGPISEINFSPDGKMIVSGDGMQTLRLWHLPSLREELLAEDDGFIKSVEFSPDGKKIVSANQNGSIKIWNLNGHNPLELIIENDAKNYFETFNVSFVNNDNTIAIGSDDGAIKLWNFDSQQLDTIGKHNGGAVQSLSLSPNGKTIVSGSGNGIIKLWDLKEKKLIKNLKGHLGKVNSVSFSPDGKIIASGGGDSTIKLWNLNGQELTTLWGDNNSIKSIDFSPNGKMIVSGGNNTVKLWLLGDTEPINLNNFSTASYNSVRFSPDGTMIASGDGQRRIKLWNTELGNLQSQGCKLIRNYIKTSINVTEEDRKLCDGVGFSDWMFIDKGRQLALEGDVENAIIEFQKAVNLNSSLKINPEQEARQIASDVFVNQANDLYYQDKFEESIVPLKKSLEQNIKIDPDLDLDPEVHSRLIATELLIQNGNSEQAFEVYTKVPNLNLTREKNSDLILPICSLGSSPSYAAKVMDACDRLVELEPEFGRFRGVRGIARAQTNDINGAIEDFEANVIWLNSDETVTKFTQESLNQLKQVRLKWIEALEAGKNPLKFLTPEEIRNMSKITSK